MLSTHLSRTNGSIYNYRQGLRSRDILSSKEKRHSFCSGQKVARKVDPGRRQREEKKECVQASELTQSITSQKAELVRVKAEE